MRVAWYLRVSGEEQRESQTILNQLDFARKYCDLHGLGEPLLYPDDGVSGAVPLELRPEGARLLRDAEAGLFKIVYVQRVDRLGRATRHVLNAVHTLESYGVAVRSGTEPLDTSTPTGRLILTMMAGLSEHERELIRERTMQGAALRTREGQWMGGYRPPYGYRVEGEKRTARLVIVEEEAETVRLIYRLLLEGMSCIRISDHLTGLGIPTARTGETQPHWRTGRAPSGRWLGTQVAAIVRNSLYCGVRLYAKRPARPRAPIPQTAPAIVDRETWERAQTRLSENRSWAKRNTRHVYQLRGLLRCGLCGLSYIGMAVGRKGSQTLYYCCAGKDKQKGEPGRCAGRYLRADVAEAAVWAEVLTHLDTPPPTRETVSADTGELAQVEAAIRGKAVERERLLALYRRGRIRETELDPQLDETEREERSLLERRETLRLQATRPGMTEADRAAVRSQCRALLAGSLTPDERQQVLRLLVREIRVQGRDLVIAWRL